LLEHLKKEKEKLEQNTIYIAGNVFAIHSQLMKSIEPEI
jgi:hypothetical protein